MTNTKVQEHKHGVIILMIGGLILIVSLLAKEDNLMKERISDMEKEISILKDSINSLNAQATPQPIPKVTLRPLQKNIIEILNVAYSKIESFTPHLYDRESIIVRVESYKAKFICAYFDNSAIDMDADILTEYSPEKTQSMNRCWELVFSEGMPTDAYFKLTIWRVEDTTIDFQIIDENWTVV